MAKDLKRHSHFKPLPYKTKKNTIVGLPKKKWGCEILKFCSGPLSDNSILFLYLGRIKKNWTWGAEFKFEEDPNLAKDLIRHSHFKPLPHKTKN